MTQKEVTAYSILSDNEAIRSVLNGEKYLFELLIRKHNTILYRIGRSYGFHHPDIEDIMQETHVAAYENLRKFEERSSYKTWLVKIMINKCLRVMEKASYKNEQSKNELSDNAKPMFTGANGFDTEKQVLNNELSHLLEKSIESIPADYRTVFILREVEGLHVSETAEILEITEANVRVKLSRAKALLRSEMQKYYTPTMIYEFNLIYCNKIVEKVFEQIDLQVSLK